MDPRTVTSMEEVCEPQGGLYIHLRIEMCIHIKMSTYLHTYVKMKTHTHVYDIYILQILFKKQVKRKCLKPKILRLQSCWSFLITRCRYHFINNLEINLWNLFRNCFRMIFWIFKTKQKEIVTLSIFTF